MSKEKTVSVKKETKAKKKSFLSFLKDMKYEKKRSFWGVILLLPWLIGVISFFLIPLLQTFYYSFFEMEMLRGGGFSFVFVGFENFKTNLMVDPDFNGEIVTAVGNALKNVPIQIFVSLFIAILLNGEYKGRGFFRLVFFVPIILATGITTVELTDITMEADTAQKFVNTEFIMSIISSSGIPAEIINYITLFVNDIFEVVTTAGVQILIFLSGLQSISPSLYESAKIEGCTKFEEFCKITLPMVSPMILVAMIYSLAESFAAEAITDTMKSTIFTNGQYGLGSAMNAIYFVVCLFVVLVATAIVSKGVFYYD